MLKKTPPPRNGCCAGTASIAVGTFCYTVDIRTEHGVVFFLITPGSAVVELDAHGLPRARGNNPTTICLASPIRSTSDLHGSFNRGKFALRNKLKESDCEIRVRSLNFHVPSGETCDFGWIDP